MKKKILALAVLIAVVIAVTCGYIKINNRFPAAIIEKAAVGDTLEFTEGVLISVDKSKFLSDDEKDKIYREMETSPFSELKIMEVTVILENQSNEKKSFSMTDMYIDSTGFSNGISKRIIDTAPDYYGALSQELQPGERKQIVLPYEILASQFFEKEWKDIENREFGLTFSAYPVQKTLELE